MTDEPTPRTEAARTLIERYAALGNDLDIFAGILAIEAEAAAQARTAHTHPDSGFTWDDCEACEPTPRTEALVWLASDGEHVQFHHVCNGGPNVDTLPNSVWPVPADGNVKPSIHCTACGFHEFLTLSPRPALMDAIEGLR